jgi:hypothetical protein
MDKCRFCIILCCLCICTTTLLAQKAKKKKSYQQMFFHREESYLQPRILVPTKLVNDSRERYKRC